MYVEDFGRPFFLGEESASGGSIGVSSCEVEAQGDEDVAREAEVAKDAGVARDVGVGKDVDAEVEESRTQEYQYTNREFGADTYVMKNPIPWKTYPVSRTPTARLSLGSRTFKTLNAITPTNI